MARAIPVEDLTIFDKRNLPEPDYDFQSGAAFLIDKPKGWSSFKVISMLRKCVDLRKVGHAGTLDPMATGLLICCVGRATKSIRLFQQRSKVYKAEITLGASTPTYDAEAKVDKTASWDHVTCEQVQNTLQENFIGTIKQVPPAFSAVKREGKPLYKRARKGEDVVVQPRFVDIDEILVDRCELPVVELTITCGTGTYIRSIANDLGKELGTLGHLTKLQRIKIGEFENRHALTKNDLEQIFDL